MSAVIHRGTIMNVLLRPDFPAPPLPVRTQAADQPAAPPVSAASGAAVMSRADRYLTRVDAYLARLGGSGAQRRFLERQLEGWQFRYAAFIASEGRTEYAEEIAGDPIDATDFVLTICGLGARLARLSDQVDLAGRIHA